MTAEPTFRRGIHFPSFSYTTRGLIERGDFDSVDVLMISDNRSTIASVRSSDAYLASVQCHPRAVRKFDN